MLALDFVDGKHNPVESVCMTVADYSVNREHRMDEQQIGRQLDAFLRLARDRGIEIRHELLEPGGGGICEIRGKPCLFLDLSSGPAEQLESIRRSLSATPPSWPVSRDTST